VLWLAAALSMIAFSLATTLRGEVERTGAGLDGVRAYYLAAGAVERTVLYFEWPQYYQRGTPRLSFDFPSGVATVEVIPESSKLSLNAATGEELFRLFAALGVAPDRAGDLALAIVNARTPQPVPPLAPLLSVVPTFQPRHASFQEIEDLLLVQGMTPELFYGTYERDESGLLVRRAGARDCLTVHAGGALDVNTSEPAVMAALGVDSGLIQAIVEFRKNDFFRTAEQVSAFTQGAPRLSLGGSGFLTVRATARLRRPDGSLSDSRRSVAALVRGPQPRLRQLGYRVVRWYDNVWAN
jgi:general secretion pathway protein K